MNLGEGTLAEESALDFPVGQVCITFNDDVADFHLVLLIHGHIKNHLVLVGHIVTLHDGDFGIVIALFIKVFLGQDLGAVDHVGRYLITFQQTEFLLHVLTFRLLQSDIVDGAHTGAHGQMDMQINLIADK